MTCTNKAQKSGKDQEQTVLSRQIVCCAVLEDTRDKPFASECSMKN